MSEKEKLQMLLDSQDYIEHALQSLIGSAIIGCTMTVPCFEPIDTKEAENE